MVVNSFYRLVFTPFSLYFFLLLVCFFTPFHIRLVAFFMKLDTPFYLIFSCYFVVLNTHGVSYIDSALSVHCTLVQLYTCYCNHQHYTYSSIECFSFHILKNIVIKKKRHWENEMKCVHRFVGSLEFRRR